MLRVVEYLVFLYNTADFSKVADFSKGGYPTSNLRIGIGHDTHRLGPGQVLRLGGVDVPHDRSLIGHSDADVLLHALIDALLGAVALGDIGQIFPNTEEKNADRDSVEMLQEVMSQIDGLGYRIVNIDCTVFAERPQLAPHTLEIRNRLCGILSVAAEAVSLKAKTGESVGPIGNEQAISAQAVALLEKVS